MNIRSCEALVLAVTLPLRSLPSVLIVSLICFVVRFLHEFALQLPPSPLLLFVLWIVIDPLCLRGVRPFAWTLGHNPITEMGLKRFLNLHVVPLLVGSLTQPWVVLNFAAIHPLAVLVRRLLALTITLDGRLFFFDSKIYLFYSHTFPNFTLAHLDATYSSWF